MCPCNPWLKPRAMNQRQFELSQAKTILSLALLELPWLQVHCPLASDVLPLACDVLPLALFELPWLQVHSPLASDVLPLACDVLPLALFELPWLQVHSPLASDVLPLALARGHKGCFTAGFSPITSEFV